MEIRIFYAVVAAAYYALVGYWWSLARDKTGWFRNEATRRLSGDAYASFLIPAASHYSVCLGLITTIALSHLRCNKRSAAQVLREMAVGRHDEAISHAIFTVA